MAFVHGLTDNDEKVASSQNTPISTLEYKKLHTLFVPKMAKSIPSLTNMSEKKIPFGTAHTYTFTFTFTTIQARPLYEAYVLGSVSVLTRCYCSVLNVHTQS